MKRKHYHHHVIRIWKCRSRQCLFATQTYKSFLGAWLMCYTNPFICGCFMLITLIPVNTFTSQHLSKALYLLRLWQLKVGTKTKSTIYKTQHFECWLQIGDASCAPGAWYSCCHYPSWPFPLAGVRKGYIQEVERWVPFFYGTVI